MKQSALLIHTDMMSLDAEAYRILRTNIQFSCIDRRLRSIVITSAEAGAGKSTVAVNLAVSLAQAGKRVLLVDGDLRIPRIHTYMHLNNEIGLTNVLIEYVDYEKAIQHYENGVSMDILTSGPIPPNPSEMLGSESMKRLLCKLENEYDMILLDSPPVGLVTDAAVLSAISGGTIIVCAAGKSKIDMVQEAKSMLDKVNANILGVILNKMPLGRDARYQKSYYRSHKS
jgi:capsular exopolysaccharide synthesis family protein